MVYRLFATLLLLSPCTRAELDDPGQLHASLAQYDAASAKWEANETDAEALVSAAESALQLGARSNAYASINLLENLLPDDSRLPRLQERVASLPLPSGESVAEILAASARALAAGTDAFAADLLRLARMQLSDLPNADLSAADLYEIRGDRLQDLGRADLARADYTRAVNDAGDITPSALVALGRSYSKGGEFEQALSTLGAIPLQAEPAHTWAQYWIALTLVARFEREHHFIDASRAFQTLDELATGFPDDEDYQSARQSLLSKLTEKQQRQLPPGPSSQLALARTLLDRGERNQAERVINALLVRRPRFADAWDLRSTLRDEHSASTDRNVARALREAQEPGDHPQPIPLYSARHYIDRAQNLLAEHPANFEGAEKHAREAITLEPNNPLAYSALAEALIARKRSLNILDFEKRAALTKDAFTAADEAIRLAPKDTELLLWRGRLEDDDGPEILQRNSRAMRYFTQGLRLDPTSRRLLEARALSATQAQRHADAAADYQLLHQLYPREDAYAYNLGLRLLSAGNFRAAITVFAELGQAHPLTASPDEDARDVAQLHAIATAAVDDESSLALAGAALQGGRWNETPAIVLYNLSHAPHHSRMLDRLASIPIQPIN